MASNKTLDRMTRSAVSRMFQVERHWRAPRHRSAFRWLRKMMKEFLDKLQESNDVMGKGSVPVYVQRRT